jgi:hypothetical protein
MKLNMGEILDTLENVPLGLIIDAQGIFRQ